jgi:hypothetical protein
MPNFTKSLINNPSQQKISSFITKQNPSTNMQTLSQNTSTNEPSNKDLMDCLMGMRNDMNKIMCNQQKTNDAVQIHDEMLFSHKNQLNWLHQKNLNNIIEISSLDDSIFVQSTNYYSVLSGLVNFYQLELKEHEIIDIYPRTRDVKINGTIVKKNFLYVVLIHECVKRRVMSAKLKKKEDPQRIFFNELLTKYNRYILSYAKTKMRAKSLFKAWSYNGKIYVKKCEGSDSQLVNSKEEVDFVVNNGNLQHSNSQNNQALSGISTSMHPASPQ